ncbi:MAG: HAD hydrolase family protein [Gemmatimonadota bacterium]|jgi:3-deoxy-D-manno-octulosonate 8-phosphate phosphatase (KDO 8-P phosphatase)
MAEGFPAGRARGVRVVVFDVDGVLTDNGVYLGATASGERVELKKFHIQDGLGLKMLQWAGLRVALVSGRESPATTLRAEELGVEARQVAGGYKIDVVGSVLEEAGADWDQLAVVGDDLADLPVLLRAGLPIAVRNAVAELRAAALWTTSRVGGDGAVREVAEAVLRARGEWAGLVTAYRRSREEGGDVTDYLESP